MKTLSSLLALCVGTSLLISGCAKPTPSSDAPLTALIIDGQNNHQIWPKSTLMMKSYLEESGLFAVDVYRTHFTWRGSEYPEAYQAVCNRCEDLPEPKTDPDFRPDFARYDLIVSNFGWKAAEWPQETKDALESYVSNGGGLVVVHAANNSWGDWEEFNQMIALGGWGGRDESSGPFVYYNNAGELVRDTTQGRAGSHGPQHEFVVQTRAPEHPIMKGLPDKWMHTKDELYAELRGPAEDMTVLATAYSSPEYKGTDRHEPMLMTIRYGDGRVFHSTLGHTDYSFESVGFITTFLRGAEWAATGEVTRVEVPDDFPTAEESRSRPYAPSMDSL